MCIDIEINMITNIQDTIDEHIHIKIYIFIHQYSFAHKITQLSFIYSDFCVRNSR